MSKYVNIFYRESKYTKRSIDGFIKGKDMTISAKSRKKITCHTVYAALCSALILFSGTSKAQQEWQEHQYRHHHVADAVINGEAESLGPVSEEKPMHISLVLPLRNESQLDELIQQIYDPNSPTYHHYLSEEQFTAQFGPTRQDYEKVVRFAERNGLRVTNTYRNRLVLDVAGSVGTINRVFNVRMHRYQHHVGNRIFYSPETEPALDEALPILHVAGLTNAVPHVPHYVHQEEANSPFRSHVVSRAAAGPGSGPGGNFIGSDMRAAYYGGTTLTGKNQTIGLVEFGGVDLNNVQIYFGSIGQNQTFQNIPIQLISVDGSGTGSNTNPNGDDTEQALDIDQVMSMAPGLSKVLVYIAAFNNGNGDVQILNKMASDNTAKILSCSWGFGTANMPADEQAFKQMAAQGQTMFVSSGDSGAYTNPAASLPQPAFYPADSPTVVSVGATHLTTAAPGGAWVSESAWTCTVNSAATCTGSRPPQGCSCSGGGASPDNIPIPSWQQLPGVITATSKGSTTLRNSPDVAMEGDFDNYVCSTQLGKPLTCSGGFAGTSFAAPRWAGYFALVDEDAASRGDPPLGFINPELYQNIGINAANYALAFHDVTSGSNGAGSPGFTAQTGYDLTTGWGSVSSKITP